MKKQRVEEGLKTDSEGRVQCYYCDEFYHLAEGSAHGPSGCVPPGLECWKHNVDILSEHGCPYCYQEDPMDIEDWDQEGGARCPNGFHRNPKTGECDPVVKRKEQVLTRSRCPRGQRRKQGKCVAAVKTIKHQLEKKEQQIRRKRCPPGHRRNKETGECDPKPLEVGKPVKGKARKRCPPGHHKNRKTGRCDPKLVAPKAPRKVKLKAKGKIGKGNPIPKSPLPYPKKRYGEFEIKWINRIGNKGDKTTENFINAYYQYCQHNVGKIFYTREGKKSDVIFFTDPRFSKQGGIVFGKLVNDNSGNSGLYIEVICGMKAGKKLMEFVIEWGKEKGLSYIQLSSLAHAILFYRNQLDFKFIKNCKQKEKAAIAKSFRKHGGKKFDDVYAANADPLYVDSLKLLQRHGFGKECNPDGCETYGMILCL